MDILINLIAIIGCILIILRDWRETNASNLRNSSIIAWTTIAAINLIFLIINLTK